MKQLYSLTTLALALTLSTASMAQTTYTAVLTGNWHDPSGNTSIWFPTEPPTNCINCVIVVDVPGTVVLNTNINLSSYSRLVVGGTNNTVLSIGNSGAADFDHGYNVVLANDGTATQLVMANSNAILNANGAGDYDGILTSFTSGTSTSYFKQMGNAPSGFVGTMIASSATPSYGKFAFGPVTLNGNGTLPIILSGFGAQLNDGTVDLSWSTSMEINSDHFAVERSIDAGAHWSVVGVVAAHGTSSTTLNYTFSDKAAAGTSQYRLQLVDRDAKFAYSEVKTIRNGMITSVSVYPNPAANFVNVTLAGSATQTAVVRLLSQSGQTLQEKTVNNAGGTTISLQVGGYPQGNYLVVVVGADGSKQVTKLMISK